VSDVIVAVEFGYGFRQIANLDRSFAAHEPHHWIVGMMAERLPYYIEKWLRQVVPSDRLEKLAVIGQ
jgi:hypothetical protein